MLSYLTDSILCFTAYIHLMGGPYGHDSCEIRTLIADILQIGQWGNSEEKRVGAALPCHGTEHPA
jgi:hypothetical protein